MIYFLRAVGTECAKIGYATNVVRRLAVLQAGNPARLEVFRQIPGDRASEAWLHAHYKARRIEREWFAYCETMHTIVPVLDQPETARPQAQVPSETALSAYLRAEGLTEIDFGQRIGVTQAAVNRYRLGHRIPRPAVLRRIAEATGGIVTANDFYTGASA